MTKVFISYSRRDSAIAHKIVDALKSRELDSWVDWEDIPPTSDWLEQIYAGIEETDAFLFLISPDSINSEFCRREFEHAAKNNKRLIPVIVRDVDQKQVPPVLGRHQWILFRPEDDFEKSFQRLDTAIQTDLVWVQAHRRLQVRALEWERNQNRSLLLRGDDLRTAEESLAASHEKDPQPTDLQRQFLLESRRSAARTRSLIGLISMIVAVALAIATFIAVLRGNEAANSASTAIAEGNRRGTAEFNARAAADNARTAEANAVNAQATTAYSLETTQIELRKARVGQLSAQAELLLNESPGTSLLLALEAARLSTEAGEPVTGETMQALRDGLAASTGVPLPGNTSSIEAMTVSPDGGWLASAGKDGIIHVWHFNSSDFSASPAFNLTGHLGSITHLAFLTEGRLVSAGEDNTIRIWDLTAKDPADNPLLLTEVPTPIDALAVSPNGRWLAAGSGAQSMVHLWDLSTADPGTNPFHLSIRDSSPDFYQLVFSPNNQTLAAGKGVIVAVWRLGNSPVEISQSVLTKVGAKYSYDPSSVAYPPRFLDFTPDSRWLVAGADTGIVFCPIESIAGCSPVALPSSYLLYINGFTTLYSMAISPTGNYLAASYSDNTLRLWDISGGRINREPTLLEGHLGPVTALAFSDDGLWLASSGGDAVDYYGKVSSGDGTTRLWRLTNKDPNESSMVLITGSRFPHLAFAPRSDWLAASSDDMSVRLFNMRTHSFSLDPLNLGDEIKSIWFNYEFNIQGRWLYYISSQNTRPDPTYDFLDLTAQDPLISITTRVIKNGPVFSPDGKWLAYTNTESAGENLHSLNALLLENLDAGKLSEPQTLLPAKANHTNSGEIAFSPDSRWLLNINFTYVGEWSAISNITLFDLRASDPTRPFQWSEDHVDNTLIMFTGVPQTVFSPNNRWLAVNNISGGRLIDLSQGDPTATPLSMQETMVIDFSPDGQMAAVVNPDGDVGIMNLLVENPIASIKILDSGAVPTLDVLMGDSRDWPLLEQLSFSSNNRWLLLVTCDKSQCLEDSKRAITLWDITQSDPASAMELLPTPAAPPTISFSPDSRWLAMLDVDGTLLLRNLESGETTKPFQTPGWSQFLFNPGSRWLAALDSLGNAAIYELDTPTNPAISLNNRYPIAALTFNPDGSLLAGGATGKVLLWKMTDFNPDLPPILLTGGSQLYNQVVFTSNGGLLIADGPDTPITAWHMDFKTVLDLACQAAGRNLTRTEWSLYNFTEPYRATCPQWPLEPEVAATPTITPTP